MPTAPTAAAFTALGAGNGFRQCPTRIDVDDYDRWTTLSGWSKENEPSSEAAKAESIAQSRAKAMALYWNYNRVIGNASSTLNDETILVTDATAGVYNFTPDSSTKDPVPPKDRVCPNPSLSAQEIKVMVSRPSAECYLQSFTQNIARMYYNDNFIGYGSGGTPFKIYANVVNGVIVELTSYLNESILPSHDEAYVEISGLHYVCEAVGENRDASLLTASNSGSGFLGGVDSTWSSAVTITSLESYTY